MPRIAFLTFALIFSTSAWCLQEPASNKEQQTIAPSVQTHAAQGRAANLNSSTVAVKTGETLNTNPDQSKSDSNRRVNFNKPSTDWWMFGATVGICLVGIGQFILFWIQLAIMRRGIDDATTAAEAAKQSAETAQESLKLSREATRNELRAYVGAVGLDTFYELREGTSDTWLWRFRPKWHNSGRTPTRNLRLHVNHTLRDTALEPGFNFDYPTEQFGAGLLHPNVALNGGLVPPIPDRAISPAEIMAIMRGDKVFYIWGWAKYLDVFGQEEHITRFCWFITPQGDPIHFVPKSVKEGETLVFPYILHSEGNCSDDECKKSG